MPTYCACVFCVVCCVFCALCVVIASEFHRHTLTILCIAGAAPPPKHALPAADGVWRDCIVAGAERSGGL